MNTLQRFFSKHTDVAMVLVVIGVLVVLFAPIPSPLLDFLILTNFSFAFLILLLTFYMARPVEFSTFPSLLLIATLFRLSLNVAATRLILSDGDAGQVIGAIGAYVVGGNYVIGLIVFLILIVVQYVVVTNGAQRISEVAARFTLDSMPGQQMSIDADLNMGFIDQEEAQRRRKNIEKEAGFYGAMDGASKFVKGDAIAGIIILLINIVGGLVIGILQHKLPWDQALRTYSLLTIGDGIVTQVPALIIAVATGIIVTRSASDGNLSQEVLKQITSFPKTLVLVGGALLGLSLLPGIPMLPTGSLILFVAAVAWITYRAANTKTAGIAGADTVDGAVAVPGDAGDRTEDPYAVLHVEPIEIHVGSHWAALVNEPGSAFMERIVTFRKQHAQDLGLVLPPVRFKDSMRLSADRYEIHLDGVVCGRGEARADRFLAIHPSGKTDGLAGQPTRDPTFGLPALWIEEEQREAAMAGNFTLVDAPTLFMTHLTEVLRRESAVLLTRSETEKLLARVRAQHSSLVEELIPTVLSVSDVQKVLQNLLREKVSIRHIEAILETLADAGRQSKDAGYLTELVRLRLGHAICQALVGKEASLQVLTLDPVIESEFLQSVQAAQGTVGIGTPATTHSFVLEPKMVEQMMVRLLQQAERMMKANLLPVLLALKSGVGICLIATGVALALCGAAHAQSISPSATADTSQALRIVLGLTVLAILPALLVCITAFLRIIIVLSMLRHAIGMTETPPNTVLIGLALFLTVFTMAPVFERVNQDAFQPFMAGKLSMEAGYSNGISPLRDFMVRQTREQDLALMVELSKAAPPQSMEDISNVQLIPAFMLSELRAAFQIGFVVFLPFLLIDLIVSSVLMTLGMMMMPPTAIALPIKILMFILIDGWSLLLKALVGSFH